MAGESVAKMAGSEDWRKVLAARTLDRRNQCLVHPAIAQYLIALLFHEIYATSIIYATFAARSKWIPAFFAA
jgi:hypothetical protein